VVRISRRLFLLLRDLGDHGLGREQQARDGGGVLQGGTGHLLRIDDAGLDQVFVFAGGDVVAFIALAALDFLNDQAAFDAGVAGQLAERGRRWRWRV